MANSAEIDDALASGSSEEEDSSVIPSRWDPDQRNAYISASSPSAPGSTSAGTPMKTTSPMQKRRRVTRACDCCRRKKIKCDGKQPCTHCTVYSYGTLVRRESTDALIPFSYSLPIVI